MDALRFVPFSSAPKVAFWQAVAERKLRDWRLDDAPRPARGCRGPLECIRSGGAHTRYGVSERGAYTPPPPQIPMNS